MSTKTKHNESAFPLTIRGKGSEGDEYRLGMTLRDWFAGQTISGGALPGKDFGKLGPVDVANKAYEIADAMLRKREKGETT